MKILVLLSTLLLPATAVSAAVGTSGLRFFYCIHAEHPCKETAAEVPVASGNAMAVAKRVLSTKDDFLGFVDAEEITLQFYVEEVDSILVDMPVPEKKGSYSAHLDRAQALKLITRLAPPLARYRSKLKLTFAKWD